MRMISSAMYAAIYQEKKSADSMSLVLPLKEEMKKIILNFS